MSSSSVFLPVLFCLPMTTWTSLTISKTSWASSQFYHWIDPSYSQTCVSLECSVDVPCTLFFMTRSNTGSLFLWNNMDIHNLLSSSILTSFHASNLDNLPIIVSCPITSLMLFVHLHIVWYNWILSCYIYGPVSGRSSMQWDPLWWLCKSLGGHFPMTAGEGPRHSHRWELGALSMHVAPSAMRIVVVPAGVTVPLGLHNPPRSWFGTMGPSLPGFTIAPHVDSLFCYRIDQAF
jgi:hypothetical protein